MGKPYLFTAKFSEYFTIAIVGRFYGMRYANPYEIRETWKMAVTAKSILTKIAKIEGIHEVFVLGSDGVVVEHAGEIGRQSTHAALLTAISANEAMETPLKQGALLEIIVVYKAKALIFSSFGKNTFLVVVAAKKRCLKPFRDAIKEAVLDLERIL